MGKILRTNISLPVDVPTATGRIKQNYQGFARDLPFINPTPDTKSSPYEAIPQFVPAWKHDRTKFSDVVNGVMLDNRMTPADMSPSDWFITSNNPSLNIDTCRPVDPHGRVFFYIQYVDVPGNLASQPTGYGPIPDLFTSCANFLWLDQLWENQSWTFTQYRYFPKLEGYDKPSNAVQGYNHRSGMFTLIEILEDIALVAIGAEIVSMVATNITWGISNDNPVQWLLHLPTNRVNPPVLFKSGDSGETWRQVAKYPYSNVSKPVAIHGHHSRFESVTFSNHNGTAVFDFGPDLPQWYYRDQDVTSGFDANAGPVGIHWQGSSGYFNFQGHCGYSTDSYGNLGNTESYYGNSGWFPALPSWVNSDPAYRSINILPVNAANSDVGLAATYIDNTDGSNTYKTVLTFTPTPSGALKDGCVTSPIVHMLQEIHSAKVEFISVSKGDLATDAYSISWHQPLNFRGGRISIEANNDTGQWSFLNGGEFIKLEVGNTIDNGDGTTTTNAPVVMAGGFVVHRALREDTTRNTTGIVKLECSDWLSRLEAKPMRDMPSFGGWKLKDALQLICNRAGIYNYQFDNPGDVSQTKYYDFSDIPDDVVLETPMIAAKGTGHISFAYTDRHSSVIAMDELCAAKNYMWGVCDDFVIRAWRVWDVDTSYSYTLNDSTYDPDTNYLEFIEVDHDLTNYRNIVRTYSKDISGNQVNATIWDPDSIYGTYGATDNYVGTDLWHIEYAPDGADPNKFAQTTLSNLSTFHTIVKYHTDVNLSLQRRQYVYVNVTGLNLAANTKFVVLEKEGQVNYSNGELIATCTYTLGIPKIPLQ